MKTMFLVYEDWTLEPNPRCFYVGKGTHRRVRLLKRNGVHTKIANHFGINRIVVFETENEHEALSLEAQKIIEHKTYVHANDYVFGANFTMGGDGVTGKRHSPESKARIIKALTGRSCSSETRRKIGERTAHAVDQFTLNGQLVNQWKSITQAATTLGFSRTKMSSSIKQGRRYQGFVWRYNSSDGSQA